MKGRSKIARMSSPRLARRMAGIRSAAVPVLDTAVEELDLGARGRDDELDGRSRHAHTIAETYDDDRDREDDPDIVDELGHALGVEQDGEAEVWTSADILGARDRGY